MAVYDDQDSGGPGAPTEESWYRTEGNNLPHTGGNTHTSQEQNGEGFKRLSNDELGNAEANAGSASLPTAPFGFNNTDSPKGLNRIRQTIGNNITRRRVAIGGGIGGVVIALIIGGFSLGSLELVHVRENLLGHNGNPLQNLSLKQRKGRTVDYLIKYFACKSNPEKCAENGSGELAKSGGEIPASLTEEGLAKSLEQEGFNVDFAKGELKFGNNPPIDITSGNTDTEISNYVDNIGSEAQQAYEGVAGQVTEEMWAGEPAIGLYRSLKTGLNDWVDAAVQNAKPGETPDQQATQLAQDAEASSDTASVQELESLDQVAKDNNLPANEVGNISDSTSITLGAQPADYNSLADEASQTLDQVAGKSLAEAAPKLAESIGLKGALAGAGSAVDPLLTVQTACKAKGVLQYVANIRNILLAIELSRFAIRYLTAADHNKAGILSSQGLRVFMLYLHRPGNNGQTYLQSGGMQHLLGNPSAPVENKDLTTFATANTNSGVFAQATGLISSVPTLGAGCKLANNALVNLGVGTVGAVATVLVGSESGVSEASGVIGVAARVLLQIVLEIAKPFIVNVLYHQVMSHAIGTGIGNGLASGYGATKTMEGQVNGLSPTTQAQAAILTQQEQKAYQKQLASESLISRYFAFSNGYSLVSHVSLMLPSNLTSLAYNLPSNLNNLLDFHSLISVFAAAVTHNNSVYAAAQNQYSQCDQDPQIQATGVATDAFCNIEVSSTPLLDIQQTKDILLAHSETVYSLVNGNCVPTVVPAPLITPDGKPISYPDGAPSCNDPGVIHMSDDINDYIKYCFSGKPNILYDQATLLKDDGSQGKPKAAHLGEHEPYTDYTQPCVRKGDPLANEAVPGTGRFARYATWYGYMNDLQNIASQVSG